MKVTLTLEQLRDLMSLMITLGLAEGLQAGKGIVQGFYARTKDRIGSELAVKAWFNTLEHILSDDDSTKYLKKRLDLDPFLPGELESFDKFIQVNFILQDSDAMILNPNFSKSVAIAASIMAKADAEIRNKQL